jgi:uncharacterized protein YecE (DUF72 family)
MEGVHLGTMGWSYEFCVGNFYPETANPRSFLARARINTYPMRAHYAVIVRAR